MRALPFALIITLVILVSTPVRAAETPCPEAPLEALIYQPWNRDLDMPEDAWQNCFSRMRTLKVRTLYVQWLRHGETDFLTARTAGGRPFAAMLFDLAQAHGMKIRAGLYHDPAYFEAIKKPTENLKSYLRQLRGDSLRTAAQVQAAFGHHPAFGGWYLPEEIDDRHWRSRERQALLTDHLSLLAEGLDRLSPGAPVSVSTFFTGQMVPGDYATMWEETLGRTGLTLLVQDGAGAGDLSLFDRRLYFKALESGLGSNHAWGVIVEAFETGDTTKGFSARPAPMVRFRMQVREASEHTEHAFLVGFSLRYFFFDGSHLGDEYRTLYCR